MSQITQHLTALCHVTLLRETLSLLMLLDLDLPFVDDLQHLDTRLSDLRAALAHHIADLERIEAETARLARPKP